MSRALEKWTTNHKGIIIKMKRLTFWLEDFLKDVGLKIEYLNYIGVLIGIPITKMEEGVKKSKQLDNQLSGLQF